MKQSLIKKREKLLKELGQINDELIKNEKKTRVKCAKCGKASAIGALPFYEYEYWDYDGGYDKSLMTDDSNSHFVCKHCGTANRILPDQILKKKRLFKEVIRTGEVPMPWINFDGGYGLE